ncbi:protein phosphatase 2C domain-containing protein [Mycoplasma sp. 744]|uniref:PP2C family protein-serine/threonine phosphatase n=1 Tax=Mycoplasma sp. 744 TaxID=3108531 RepID=UPI002B1E52CA|nr:protein phosphatase 2C domain-containing protein [Mycoplasma sp. 744]MEA4115239.1 protein phosphatase 2C domain-containing protein [Mycoplasma sp. 744]
MQTAKLTNIGIKRLENQDCIDIFTNNNFILMILCDGMGGHFGGSLASTITLNVFKDAFYKLFPLIIEKNNLISWLSNTIKNVKNEMKKIANNDEAKLDMGTTLTGVLFNNEENIFIVFNIGDSRIYALKNNGILEQITKDHNILNKLIYEDNYKITEAKKFPRWRALTSALGPTKKTKMEIFDLGESIHLIKKIIATSDGIHSFLNHSMMETILNLNKEPEMICELMINEAINNFSDDNLTIGIIDLE